MIGCVGNGLDQHEDSWNLRALPLISKREDLTRFPLLCNCDQFFPRPLRSSPQFVEARKGGPFLKPRGGKLSSKALHIAFFAGEDVDEGLAHTAKRASRGGIQLCIRQVCTRVEQTQVRPEGILEKVG